MVGFALIGVLLRAGLGTNAAILLTIFAVVGLAYCLRRWVERPAERWIKGLAQPKAKDSNVIRQKASYGLVRI
jgi:peptidoglycan/LPS O-acetylase OafA/YrhL